MKTAILDIKQFEPGENRKEFYANTIENHIITNHRNIHKPHKHNFYLTVLFTQGTGIHEIDFTSYPVKPGSLFFLNPGQTHHWELSEDIRGYIFFHTQTFYDLHYNRVKINNYPFFYSVQNAPFLYLDDNAENFSSVFNEILVEYQGNAVLKTQKIINLIDRIYIESTRLYIDKNTTGPAIQSPYALRFQELERLIEKHYKTEKSPSQYAEWLNVSPKHLNRITQSMVGKTTSDVILDRVFLEAKRELVRFKNNFAEVAAQLGYDDYAYFSRLFKKKCGETPSSFINRYR
ncbi:helix-turn-helix domain-containing protein [Flavobacterium cerinum]|uniref:AraC family transcriptional regulator n=1 Tax=Flavobacterium cerinum TaxID=2502784 RepID=A0ABY5IM06_9FLAO|nr:AraC family transcriptional regulator [Flavobacterium cerinum]UUC43825.1 AraC family transcriptional regulator [Flavobacterium cerinum]